MNLNLRKLLAISMVTGVLNTGVAHAVAALTTSNETAPAATSSWSPSYTINTSADILFGKAPIASSGDFTFERSGGTVVLTDGAVGAINNDGGPTATHPAIAAFGPTSAGNTITYQLTSPTLLSSVVIYSGWNDSGRDQANFTVLGSTDGANFVNIGTVNFNPTIATGVQSVVRVTFTETAGINSTAYSYLRVNTNANTENGYSGLLEISAFAVPEASASALIGAFGVLGLLRRRRVA